MLGQQFRAALLTEQDLENTHLDGEGVGRFLSALATGGIFHGFGGCVGCFGLGFQAGDVAALALGVGAVHVGQSLSLDAKSPSSRSISVRMVKSRRVQSPSFLP